MPMPLPGFRLAQLVAANGAQPQAPLSQPIAAGGRGQRRAGSGCPCPPISACSPPLQAANALAAPDPGADAGLSQPGRHRRLAQRHLQSRRTAGSPRPDRAVRAARLRAGGVAVAAGQPVDPMTVGLRPDRRCRHRAAVAGSCRSAPDRPKTAPAPCWPTPPARSGTLGDFRSYVERFEKNGQVFFRARFVGFGGRDDATAMCNQLKQQNMSCLAMQS